MRVNDNYSNTSSQKVVTTELAMPHDLPINYPPVHLNPALNEPRHGTTTTASSRGSFAGNQTPPWLAKGSSQHSKRPLSQQDLVSNGRPQKRLGTERHKSLVIDFDSEDEDSRDHVTTTARAPHMVVKADERQASAAKLKQVEAEIAQAMAVINKAQQLQNARKLDLSRSTTPTNISNSEASVSATKQPVLVQSTVSKEPSMMVAPKVASVPGTVSEASRQAAVLEALRAEVSSLDTSISVDRKALVAMRIESAELQKQRNIADIRRSDSQEAIQKLQSEISRLEQELAQEQHAISQLDEESSELDRTLSNSVTTQERMSLDIKSKAERRQVILAKIRPLERRFPLNNTHIVPGVAADSTGALGTSSLAESRSSSIPLDASGLQIQAKSEVSEPIAMAPMPNVNGIHEVYTRPRTNDSDKADRPMPQSPSSLVSSIGSTPVVPERKSVLSGQTFPLESQIRLPNNNQDVAEKSSSAVQVQNENVRQKANEQKSAADTNKPRSTANTLLSQVSQGSSSTADSATIVELTTSELQPLKELLTVQPEPRLPSAVTAAKASSTPVTTRPPTTSDTSEPRLMTEATFAKAQDQGLQSLYSSPLSKFKSFKYHPQYCQTVSSGFRSSTYFHKISQDQLLCKFETQGGLCNAANTCKDQHFSQLLMVYSTPEHVHDTNSS